MPERLQLSRRKGYRKPEGSVVVSRPSRWGNPWGKLQGYSREDAVGLFETYLIVRRIPVQGWVDTIGYPSDEEIRRELRGKDLACWCALPAPGERDVCHAALLLYFANLEVTS